MASQKGKSGGKAAAKAEPVAAAAPVAKPVDAKAVGAKPMDANVEAAKGAVNPAPAVASSAPAQDSAAKPASVAAAGVAPTVQAVADAAGLAPFYANFARVTGSPEELILDFGLNPQPMGQQTKAIQVQRRLVLNFFTAKRLLAALNVSIQRHELAFGKLETDVSRRVTQRTEQPK